MALQFIEILDRGPAPSAVSTFLTTYPRVLGTVLGHFNNPVVYRETPDLGCAPPDLAVGTKRPTAGAWVWRHFFFCPVDGPFFEQGSPAGALRQAVEKLRHLQGWLRDHEEEAGESLLSAGRGHGWGGLEPHRHNSIAVLAGRRDRLSERDQEGIRSLIDQGIAVHSYDWLIEACLMAERADERRGYGPGV